MFVDAQTYVLFTSKCIYLVIMLEYIRQTRISHEIKLGQTLVYTFTLFEWKSTNVHIIIRVCIGCYIYSAQLSCVMKV